MMRGSSARRVASTAILVGVAYYVGAEAGLVFRFPPATPSVIWPPNSILTATLLMAAPGRWWIYLLAALPAHMAAELPAGWPTSQAGDRKSTRLNSSHVRISYAVF